METWIALLISGGGIWFGAIAMIVAHVARAKDAKTDRLALLAAIDGLRQQGDVLKAAIDGLKQQGEALRQQGEALRQQGEALKQQGEALKISMDALKEVIVRTAAVEAGFQRFQGEGRDQPRA